jgi:hypothetical protein
LRNVFESFLNNEIDRAFKHEKTNLVQKGLMFFIQAYAKVNPYLKFKENAIA